MDEVSMLQIPRETNVGSKLPMLTRERHIERLPNTKNQETNLIHFDMAHNIIDADRLKAKLDEHYSNYQSKYMETRTPYTQGLIDALDLAEQVIDSLQQGQPKINIPSAGSGAMGTTPPKFKLDVKPIQPDVDLAVEIDFEWAKCNPIDEGMGSKYANISIEQFDALAHHFYELGLKAKKL